MRFNCERRQIGMRAVCQDCGWTFQGKRASREASLHVRRTGHDVLLNRFYALYSTEETIARFSCRIDGPKPGRGRGAVSGT